MSELRVGYAIPAIPNMSPQQLRAYSFGALHLIPVDGLYHGGTETYLKNSRSFDLPNKVHLSFALTWHGMDGLILLVWSFTGDLRDCERFISDIVWRTRKYVAQQFLHRGEARSDLYKSLWDGEYARKVWDRDYTR